MRQFTAGPSLTAPRQLVSKLKAITTILVNADLRETPVHPHTWTEIAGQLLEASTFACVQGEMTPGESYETRSDG